MKRRWTIGTPGVAALLSAAPLLAVCKGVQPTAERASGQRPSIVLVSLDNVRWDHTSLSGYERDTTPNLARFARSPGARVFERTWSPAAWSLPAYASVFTGHDALDHGVGFRTAGVDGAHATLAEMLAAYGYRTAAFCSGPHLDPATQLGRGFSTYEHLTPFTSISVAVDGALRWVTVGAEDPAPFFIFVHGYDAHTPYSTPSELSEVFDRGYQGRLHSPLPGQVESCAWTSPTRTCTHALVSQTPEELHAVQDRWAETDLLLGPEQAWFRVPGGQRVDVADPDQREALWGLYQAHEETPGEPRTVAELQQGWHRTRDRAVPEEPRIAAALASLRLAGLDAVLEERDDGVFFPSALPVRSLELRLDFEPEDVHHFIAHYDSALLTADYQLGRLLRGLDERGVLEHALVIVMADHGEALGENGRFAHDAEDGDKVFRVPLLVRLPDGARASRPAGIASLSDLVPTLADYLDVPAPAGIEGISLMPLIRGEAGTRMMVREASMCCYGVRSAEWELRGVREADVGFSLDGLPIRPIAPLARNWGPMRWELYRDGAGPDVAAEHPDVVAELRAALAPWPEEPDGDPRVTHGAVNDRPDLQEALRTGGYWGQDRQEPPAPGAEGTP